MEYHGTSVEELNDAYTADQNHCPATAVEAASHSSNCMESDNDKGKGKTLVIDKDVKGTCHAHLHTGGKHCFNGGEVNAPRRLVLFVTLKVAAGFKVM